MKIEDFYNMYINTGTKLKKICGYYFKPHGWRNYSIPLNYKITVNDNLIKSLKWKYLISTIFTDSKRKNAIEFILETNNYEIDKFDRKTRNRINKSLNNCLFRWPELEDMLIYGLKINRQTLERQHRRDKVLTNDKLWSRYITTLYSQPDIMILGAYFQKRMVGYLVTFKLEGVYNILQANIDRQDSEITSPMCGLIYTLVNQLIKENESVILSYGLDQFSQLNELCRFKRNMLFKQVPSSRVYIINPLLLILFKLIIYTNIQFFKWKSIKNPLLRKIIYLYQGSRMLSKYKMN